MQKNANTIDEIINSLINMKDQNNAFKGAILSRNDIDYKDFYTWEWPQGVALYGILKKYKIFKNQKDLNILIDWFTKNINHETEKNVNTCAPILTLLELYIITKNKKYKEICDEWIFWIINELPKTEENGFQHIVSERKNDGELWDDTIMMVVLFLLKYGTYFNKKKLIDMALYQVLIHFKYLLDPKTSLFYHGWNFNGRHNFANALWNRGNSWITFVLPEILEIMDESILKTYFKNVLNNQITTLIKLQDQKTGLWHTLLNDETSYLEMSGSTAIAAGILKAQRLGYIDKDFNYKTLYETLLNNIIDGQVNLVSYGTPMGHDLEFYKNIPITNMPYGQSLALLFLIEVENHE